MSGLYVGLAGAALSAGTSIYGSSQQPDGISIGRSPAATFDPRSDPALAALGIEQAINIGQFNPGTLDQFAPAQRLLNTIGTGGAGDVRRREVDQMQQILANMRQVIDGVIARGGSREEAIIEANNAFHATQGMDGGRIGLVSAISAAGFGHLNDLIGQEFDFKLQRPEIEAEAQSVSDAVRQGRNDARRTEAEILSDLFVPTATNLERTVDQRTQDEFDAIAAFINEQANVGGFNPAGALANEGLNATSRAQDNALQFIMGLVGAQGGQLGNIRGTLAGQENNAINVANTAINASLGSASLASQQAISLAGLDAQLASQAGAARNAGISNAGNSLANGAFTAAILPRILGEPTTNDGSGFVNQGGINQSVSNAFPAPRLGAGR